MSALVAVKKFTWVACEILSDVINGFVYQTERDLCRYGFAVAVFGGDSQRTVFAWLILRLIGGDFDVEKMLIWRDDELFCVGEKLTFIHHRRVQKNVRFVFFFDRNFQQFYCAVQMHKLVAQQIFGFDGKQNPAVADRRGNHHQRFLSGANRVFVDNNFKAAVPVTKFRRCVRCHPYGCLAANDRSAFVGARPGDAVITCLRWYEVKFSFAFVIRLDGLRSNIVVLITTKFQSPIRWRKRLPHCRSLIIQASEFIAFDFASVRIQPDFVPEITRDFDCALGLHRLIICVNRLDVGGDFITGAINIVFGLRVNIVALPRHAHIACRRNFTVRRIGHPGFNGVFKILSGIARRIKTKRSFAVRVRLNFFAFDNLSVVSAVVIIAVLVVIPIVITRRTIVVIERVLMHYQFNVGVIDRAAKVIIGLHLNHDFFTELEGFFLPIFFWRRNRNFEFRQLVFFDAEELRVANIALATCIIKINLILTKRHHFRNVERSPRAAE